ncbi:MAG TPA: bacillithiol biosynthesis cysteine-adding enzyme BshC [Candidatus Acidoferrales bacterium]
MSLQMEPHCISFREIPQTTKIYSSFLDDFEHVAKYYAYAPNIEGVVDAARNVQLDPAVRKGVVEVLREQNRKFAPGGVTEAATEKNLERLAAGAVAVVTGQQVGLFGGPAYSLYKAITAASYAAELTNRGIDAVPVFWLATEDHDLAEINHAAWNSRAGFSEFKVEASEAKEGKRVGEILLGEGITALVAGAVGTLEGADAEKIATALRESYTPNETYGSAFGKLLARLLVGRGIVFIDPLDVRLHRLSARVYRRALDESDALREALMARSKELESGGLHAQVKVAAESTLLFYNVNGVREPLRVRGGKFHAGQATFTVEELRAAIESAPDAFTPNVLLRPIVQDTLLPTAAYVGGPAEVAYMAQAEVVYQKLLGRMPAILPRSSFTVIEPGMDRILDKFELSFRDVTRGRQHLRTRMEQKFLPAALAEKFEKDEKALQELLAGYREPISKLDASLAGSLELAEQKILHQFGTLKAKAGRAESMRNDVLDRKEKMIFDALYPHHELQERTVSALPWLAAYGGEFLDGLGQIAPIADALISEKHGDSDLAHMGVHEPNPVLEFVAACANQHHVVTLSS